MDNAKLYKLFVIAYGILITVSGMAILGLFITNGPDFLPNFTGYLDICKVSCFIGIGLSLAQTLLFFFIALRKNKDNEPEYRRTVHGILFMVLFITLVLLSLLIKEAKNSFD